MNPTTVNENISLIGLAICLAMSLSLFTFQLIQFTSVLG
jgi:hypothetical protein